MAAEKNQNQQQTNAAGINVKAAKAGSVNNKHQETGSITSRACSRNKTRMHRAAMARNIKRALRKYRSA